MSRWARLRLTVSPERAKEAVIRGPPWNGVLKNCWSINRIRRGFSSDSVVGAR
jgi:hypothetical protein